MKFIIDFIDTSTQAEVDAYLTEHQCTLIGSFSSFNKVFHVEAALQPPVTDLITEIVSDHIDALKLLTVIPFTQELSTASPDTVIDIHADKDWWKTYSMQNIDFTSNTMTVPRYGLKTNLYMVDSGIDASHPEFIGKDITNVYSVTGEFSDTTGHGTALSSVAIGTTCGLTDASLKIVKIFDKGRPILQSELLYAFDAIIQDMQTSANRVSVINLSWSIAKNPYIESKLAYILAAGGIIVASAGNSGLPIADVTPASMPGVLAIGSYSVNFVPSSFTDYTGAINQSPGAVNSGQLSSWAPGENIWVATLDGTEAFAGGTSISAAIYSASICYNFSQYLTGTGNLMYSLITDAPRPSMRKRHSRPLGLESMFIRLSLSGTPRVEKMDGAISAKCTVSSSH